MVRKSGIGQDYICKSKRLSCYTKECQIGAILEKLEKNKDFEFNLNILAPSFETGGAGTLRKRKDAPDVTSVGQRSTPYEHVPMCLFKRSTLGVNVFWNLLRNCFIWTPLSFGNTLK